ncbi:hypothetical protein F4802DRAFT_603803 [Xylaria palmicola]|nr:hypothetical protein F4802DRAFT_603803 [Xylaria palmicola]
MKALSDTVHNHNSPTLCPPIPVQTQIRIPAEPPNRSSSPDSRSIKSGSKMPRQPCERQRRRPRSNQPPSRSKTASLPSFGRPTASSSARIHTSTLRLPSASTLSSSQSRPRTAPNPYSDVAASNPEYTTWLWNTVMSYLAHTASSGEKMVGPSASATTPMSSSARRGQSQTLPTSGSSARTRKEMMAKVTDVDFDKSVLEPYGIAIVKTGTKKDLRRYFDIVSLPSDPRDRLAVYKQSTALNAWLEPDAGRVEVIKREYKALQVYGSNEAEYSALALRDLFLDEPRYPWLAEEEGENKWLPIRMLQLVCKPPQGEWLSPPLINAPLLNKRYEWDIRPDCAYHVSLQAFKSRFRTAVRQHVSVIQKRAFCPYLTIEFKKDEENIDTACHQVAVASAIALYNRFRLKQVALEMSGDKWSEAHKSQVRHYSITLAGSGWNLWCTVPKTFDNWTGCTMSTISLGDCCVLSDVELLMSAVNDIHYWGLYVHGMSCKADIYAKVRSSLDAEMNDISMLDDDDE